MKNSTTKNPIKRKVELFADIISFTLWECPCKYGLLLSRSLMLSNNFSLSSMTSPFILIILLSKAVLDFICS